MSEASTSSSAHPLTRWLTPGVGLFVLACLAAAAFFREGLAAMWQAWQLPEYSHGPIIPLLSLLLYLRQLKEVPQTTAAPRDTGAGLALLIVSLVLAALGKLSGLHEIVAYAFILWVGAVLLIVWGWRQGRQFWPGVLHLVFMLPLPGLIYYKMTGTLQLISSEVGVFFLQVLNVPVFLEGNIIDFGVYRLHVAEACSGLRYLFPIMSFSYIFASLYVGPNWHRVVLLLAAAPIAILMNSVRIAFAGWLVNYVGLSYLEGFTHFFEGWVIFVISIVLLFAFAGLLIALRRDRPRFLDALDLDTSGLGTQAARLQGVVASGAMGLAVGVVALSALTWELRPAREVTVIERDPLVLFPREMGGWTSSPRQLLDSSIELVLGADDYHSVNFSTPEATAPVDLFIAYYTDQSQGGTHSPEVCLPGAGWEIAWIERSDIGPALGLGTGVNVNRAVIQKGDQRMMAYYWFEQHGRHVAWDYAAKFWLVWDGVTLGRTDGAMVRLLTPIVGNETEAEAEARLRDIAGHTLDVLPRFVPEG